MLWCFILILPYIIIILRIYLSLLKIRPFNNYLIPKTSVSIVIACRNEYTNLPCILDTIAGQDYNPTLLEILIVDDNSSDNTFKLASSFKSPFRLVALHNRGNGKKQALRTGIEASSGELIITTDADCIAGKRWISTIAAFYEKYNSDLIICPVQGDPGSGFSGRFRELEFLSLQGITAGSAVQHSGVMCNGANLAFTRKAYMKHSDNLHDEIGSGDDIFLLHSLKKDPTAEISWLESTDAIVTAAFPATFRSFMNQRKRWISKWPAYSDPYTIILGIATFITVLTQIFLLSATLTDTSFIGNTILVFLAKSVPDFLILNNTTHRYKRQKLMWWFIPAQLVYPFYVLLAALYSVTGNRKQAG